MRRSLILLAAGLMSTSAWATPQTYEFDPVHSIPHFSVEHLGFATIRGRFDKAAGKATIDTVAKTGSVEFRIQAASVNSGDGTRADGRRSRDDHMKSADFFNVAEFPELIFRSTRVNFKGDAVESVEGNFTMLGVTKPIKIAVTQWKCGPHPFNKRAMCGAELDTTIKRSEWGMKFGVPTAVGDAVRITFGIEAAAAGS